MIDKIEKAILAELNQWDLSCSEEPTLKIELAKALGRAVKNCSIPDVVGRTEQLVCDCGNRLTDKEMYFGQCLQCDKNIEEAN